MTEIKKTLKHIANIHTEAQTAENNLYWFLEDNEDILNEEQADLIYSWIRETTELIGIAYDLQRAIDRAIKKKELL